ncbi:hypothetical protein FQA39_LY07890 [Lamprigera yunnana]|nr:hypothetical protein FQA39_LY07890 [Lamprigera yunnana]
MAISQQFDFKKICAEFEGTIDENARDCYKENNLTRKQLDDALALSRLPNDRSIKCFLNCVMTHLDMVDESGNLVEDNFKKYLYVHNDVMEDQIYKACKDLEGDDGCEKMYNIAECLVEILAKNSD